MQKMSQRTNAFKLKVLSHVEVNRDSGTYRVVGTAITMVFYPKITNFWIVLILKSSEDLALIR